ncbi:MAG: lactate utilization protein [Desulfonatronovibrionaceae bacterium]
MADYLENYWLMKLKTVKKNLVDNNFEAQVVRDGDEARQLVLETIIPQTNPGVISWAGSATFKDCGLYRALSEQTQITVIDTYKKEESREQVIETRRKALLSDLFILGTNAVTENGALVNLDMIGNRTGALTFGPKHVVVLAGRNKVVPDIEAAASRIKNFAAPANAMRLEKKTPCAKTGECEDCQSPDRICNVWTISEKSFPKGRIKVVLINKDMGL